MKTLPIRVSGRMLAARLLLTTALVGLSPLMLPGEVFGQATRYFDNVSGGGLNPTDGPWSMLDPVWANSGGGGHQALEEGDTGVFDRWSGSTPITVTVGGIVLPGELRAESNGFTLTGGQIGEAGRALTFSAYNNVTFNVNSKLAGNVTIDDNGTNFDNGTIVFGAADSAIESLHVKDDTNLNIVAGAITTGTLTNEGDVNLSGSHTGNVENQNELILDGATITGELVNNTGSDLIARNANTVLGPVVNWGRLYNDGASDASLEVTGGNTFTNHGDIVWSGGGTLLIKAAELDLRHGGTVDSSAAKLEGLISNRGVLRYTTAGSALTHGLDNYVSGQTVVSSDLNANNNDIRNTGSFLIDTNGQVNSVRFLNRTVNSVSGDLLLRGELAGALQNEEDAQVEMDGGVITGTVENHGDLFGEGTITGSLDNASTGVLRVNEDQSVGEIDNQGEILFQNDSTLTLTQGNLANSGKLHVSGDILSTGGGQVQNLANGVIALNGGDIEAEVVNSSGGRVVLREDTRVDGDFRNEGTLDKNVLGEVTIDVSGHDFYNSHELLSSGSGQLHIQANNIYLQAGTVHSSAVKLDGRVVNSGDLNYNSETVLSDDLVNEAGGAINVQSNLNADFNAINNAGAFNIEANRHVYNVSQFDNSGVLVVRDGATITTGTMTNAANGRLTVYGTINNALTNELDGTVALAGGRVNGAFNNAGNLTGEGRIDGILSNTKNVTVRGDFDVNAVENEGAIHVIDQGELILRNDELVNRGLLKVDGIVRGYDQDSVLKIENVENARLQLNGARIRADVTNALGGNVSLVAGSRVDGNFTNDGRLTLDGSASSTDLDNLDVRGSVFTNNGEILKTGTGEFRILADELRLNNGTVTSSVVTLVGKIVNSAGLQFDTASELFGELQTRQGGTTTISAVLDARNHVISNAGSTVVKQGHAIVDAARIDNSNLFTVEAQGEVTTGRLINAENGDLRLRGTVNGRIENAANASVTLGGGTVNGVVLNAGELTGNGVIGGRLENYGTVLVDGTGTLQVAGLLNNEIVEVATGATLRTDTGIDNHGTFIANGAIRIDGTGSKFVNRNNALLELNGGALTGTVLNQEGGRVNINADTTVMGSFENDGDLRSPVTVPVKLEMLGGGDFVNTGTIIADTQLTIIADRIMLKEGDVFGSNIFFEGDLFNSGNLIYEVDSSLSNNIGNLRNGKLRITANVDGKDFSIDNDGEMFVGRNLNSNSVGNLHNVAELTNSYKVLIDEDASVEADVIQNTGSGVMTIRGDLEGAVSNAGQGKIDLDGGTITGTVTNDALLEGAGTIAGQVANTGRINVTGDMTITDLQNDGQLNVGSGKLTSGQPIVNNGTARIAGTVQGTISNQSGGLVNLEEGIIVGDLENANQVNARGRVTGVVTNNGTLATTGTLDVGRLVNNATSTVREQDELIARNGVDNTGTLNLDGDLTGALRNAANGKVTLGADSKISGSVTNAGNLQGHTQLNGNLNNSGVARISGTTGVIENSGTLRTEGNLTASSVNNSKTVVIANGDSLTTQNGLDNTGTVIVRGDLTTLGDDAQVTNRDQATLALDGASVYSRVVNEAGGLIDIRSSSTIYGDLVNRGDIDMTKKADDVRLRVYDGTFTNSGEVKVTGGGFLTIEADNIALEEGSVIDNERVDLIGSVANNGDLVYRRDATLTGDLRNNEDGAVVIRAEVDGQDGDTRHSVINSGSFQIGGTTGPTGQLVNVERLENSGNFTIHGGSRAEAEDALNRDGGRMTIAGTLVAPLSNRADSTVSLEGGRIEGDVDNAGNLTGDGHITGSLLNSGTTSVVTGQRLAVTGGVTNNQALNVAGTLDAQVTNNGTLRGGGEISRSVSNSGNMIWTGVIAGDLVNDGNAQVQNTIGGDVTNRGVFALTGDLRVDGAVLNSAAGGNRNDAMTIGAGRVLTAAGGVTNESRASLVNEGRIVGNIDNRGNYTQTGTLDGSLTSQGNSSLSGRVTGNVDYLSGRMDLAEGMTIGGDLNLRNNYSLARDRSITATRTVVATNTAFDLAGTVNGDLRNVGNVNVSGATANVSGRLTNTGVVDLTGNRGTGDELRVNSLAGNGKYHLNVDLRDMTADRITVQGGAATGHYELFLDYAGNGAIPEIGQSVILIDVDERRGAANDYTISVDRLPIGSERIAYAVQRVTENGDLQFSAGLNPAIGGLIGNVTLTQTLIGSIVNRPTSPFVTGLAYEDPQKPCGVGAWGRATGGTATTTGASDTGINRLESTISTSYYGMQVGSDLACFDNRYGGWNMAFGVLAGVNQGDTTQPVYVTDPLNPDRLTSFVSSVNKTEFTQAYGGVYATATRDRFQADLQIRAERTDFTIRNNPVGNSKGLGLSEQDFSSTSRTISGSVGYSLDVPNMEGWSVVPTAGFAWSSIKTDSIKFDPLEEGIDEYLHFEDSNRTIGFLGATVAKTFVQPSSNSAVYAFATGTVYHDFADPTVSVFERVGDNSLKPQRLESDNLGTYGEVSFGANYIKVLSEGARARQFSTSARIDARFGDGLESVGVTGQVRWQF
ncbi:autotransporter outer membrane beta-barrel domain-containing protein [Paracoccus caeni]|nr:autotransporter outer membrane beta-barrel domain-containing protein [Paracoccus caeni]